MPGSRLGTVARAATTWSTSETTTSRSRTRRRSGGRPLVGRDRAKESSRSSTHERQRTQRPTADQFPQCPCRLARGEVADTRKTTPTFVIPAHRVAAVAAEPVYDL